MKILQVNSCDFAGGAEKVSWSLFQAYRTKGHRSWLVVGKKRSDNPNVIPMIRKNIEPFRSLSEHGKSNLSNYLVRAKSFVDRFLGFEDFNYPVTWELLNRCPELPDIIHCHNLHGGYFDLRVLPWLSRQVPVILTLHDAWLLSGHCSHSFDCERWKTGCGHCPDLTIYPSIRRDATAYNWYRKQALYSTSRFYLATPCQWLIQKVDESMLTSAVIEKRVIPNGVNLQIFHPAEKERVRSRLNIPNDAKVLLFAANNVRKNIFKDFPMIQTAVKLVSERLRDHRILFMGLGDNALPERIGRAETRFIPIRGNPQEVALYYQAADVYIHAARADTFPNSVLEALACGIPVVATAVGGIPEQIKGYSDYGQEEATGVLVPVSDPGSMAVAIEQLLSDDTLRLRLARNARQDVEKRFDLNRQADDYLAWYKELIDKCVVQF